MQFASRFCLRILWRTASSEYEIAARPFVGCVKRRRYDQGRPADSAKASRDRVDRPLRGFGTQARRIVWSQTRRKRCRSIDRRGIQHRPCYAARAVEELVNHLKKATDQELPVARENVIPAGYDTSDLVAECKVALNTRRSRPRSPLKGGHRPCRGPSNRRCRHLVPYVQL